MHVANVELVANQLEVLQAIGVLGVIGLLFLLGLKYLKLLPTEARKPAALLQGEAPRITN